MGKEKSSQIYENTRRISGELPPGVALVAAAKTRTANEILKAVDAGVKIVGENYVQEAVDVFQQIGKAVDWHFIGHLQKNKVKKAVEIFDMIETVDSYELAMEIDKRCSQASRIMYVLIEINSGREKQKFGVLPENTIDLVKKISRLSHVKISGLMTMGPRFGNPEDSRPYFIITRRLFDEIKALNITGVEMKYLSMGMTNSYKIAIEEGANVVRIGSKIFGRRDCC